MLYLLSSKGIATVLRVNRVSFIIETRERPEETFIDVIFKTADAVSFRYTFERSVLERFGSQTSAKSALWEKYKDRLINASALRISFVQFLKDAPVVIPENVSKIKKINLK